MADKYKFVTQGKRKHFMNTARTDEHLPVHSRPLSVAQKKMLKTIKSLCDKNGLFPTYGEIAQELGIATQSVYDCVRILVKKGYLKRKNPRKSRSLEIVVLPIE